MTIQLFELDTFNMKKEIIYQIKTSLFEKFYYFYITLNESQAYKKTIN